MNRTLLLYHSFLYLSSYLASPPQKRSWQTERSRTGSRKQLAFPLDEQTYYLSKSMFQFEENGKEYLHFENTRKSLYDIVILISKTNR